ncbi:MAG: beta-1,6-N-acetylglucosaminyltransferase [Anaerolineaceae bacterium]|nr:beta-1,6-N-acetylglucosaminyltransferase [Anaerolineaceae bacterium]
MKMVYMLLVHTNPDQIVRLVNRLNTPQTRFVIHVSKNCEPDVYETLLDALKPYPNIAFAKRTVVKWGNFGIIRALLNCFDMTCSQGYSYDRAYILSGQDYPLQSNTVIQQTLAGFGGQQIMEYFLLPDDIRGHSNNRWRYYHFWLGKYHLHLPLIHPANVFLMIASWLTALLLPRKKIPSEMQLYGGSFWSSFTPQAISYFHNFVLSPQGKKTIQFFKYNLHPAEMFLQTVLMNSPLKDTIANINLHYVKFPPESGHPVFFTAKDFDELASKDELFARKINSRIDNHILDLLDQKMDTR